MHVFTLIYHEKHNSREMVTENVSHMDVANVVSALASLSQSVSLHSDLHSHVLTATAKAIKGASVYKIQKWGIVCFCVLCM